MPSGVCTVRQREDSHCLELQAAPGSPALQDAVSQLCCAVWTAKVEGREAVVAQTLPYLIIRALTSGGLRRMQRAWQLVQHMQRAEPANGIPVRWSTRPRAQDGVSFGLVRCVTTRELFERRREWVQAS